MPLDLETRLRRAPAGAPMDAGVRAAMEEAFGADFGNVRIHRESTIAPQIQAEAFTNGDDIHVAPGVPGPETVAGRSTLAHELAHVTQHDATRIRRKIGFEFEDGTWRPWQVDRSTTWGVAATPPQLPARINEDPVSSDRKRLNLDLTNPVRPVARKQRIHLGSGFRLEGDDTPGPAASNIEFVTTPFTEDLPGLQALLTALREMSDIVDRLGGQVGRPGPKGVVGAAGERVKAGPPWPYDPYDYVTERNHGLTGSADVSSANVVLSAGSTTGFFKMQATSGVTLAEIPELLKTYGRPANEPAERTAAMKPARDLSGIAQAASDIAGRAPAMAVHVMERMVAAAPLTEQDRRGLADRNKLRAAQGYLSLVIMYLKGFQIPSGVEGAKAGMMFLVRNRFSDLYAELAPDVRNLFALAGGNLLCAEVLAVSNATPLITHRGVQRDAGLAAGNPLINPVVNPPRQNAIGEDVPAVINPQQTVVSPFTIGHWLRSVAVGEDHLTPIGMATWLRNNAGVEAGAATAAAEAVFESFGEYDLDRAGGQPLALLENRAILPEAHTKVMGGGGPFADVAQMAFNYLLYSARQKRGVEAPYPDEPVPRRR